MNPNEKRPRGRPCQRLIDRVFENAKEVDNRITIEMNRDRLKYSVETCKRSFFFMFGYLVFFFFLSERLSPEKTRAIVIYLTVGYKLQHF